MSSNCKRQRSPRPHGGPGLARVAEGLAQPLLQGPGGGVQVRPRRRSVPAPAAIRANDVSIVLVVVRRVGDVDVRRGRGAFIGGGDDLEKHGERVRHFI